jgi:hypothetical protein
VVEAFLSGDDRRYALIVQLTITGLNRLLERAGLFMGTDWDREVVGNTEGAHRRFAAFALRVA